MAAVLRGRPAARHRHDGGETRDEEGVRQMAGLIGFLSLALAIAAGLWIAKKLKIL